MKRMKKILWRSFLVLGSLGLLTACAVLPKERIASNAIDYNLTVEKVHNEIILLNIVRASKRRPMYFTAFSAIRGGMTNAIQTGGLNIPFGNGSDAPFSIAPSVSHSFNPTYEFSVLDGQEFMQGIMKPVPMELVYYFQQQGWPKAMLLHLFVKRIDFKEKEGVRSFENYPRSKERPEKQDVCFQKYIESCNVVSRNGSAQIGGPIDIKSASDLKRLVEVQNAKLQLKKDDNSEDYHLTAPKTAYFLECKNEIINTGECNVDRKDVPKEKSEDDSKEASKTGLLEVAGTDSKKDNKVIGEVYLRSPEAIIYYLGELARESIKGNINEISICKDEKKKETAPLFVVKKSSGEDKAPAVAVDYEGVKYIIEDPETPNSCTMDRSMHVLSLVSQLLSLHKVSKEMPSTGVVQVIGR